MDKQQNQTVGNLRGPYVPSTTPKNEHGSKVVKSLQEIVKLCGLTDGMTISFHHHFRSGDRLVDWVLDSLAEMGFKNLTVLASSLPGGHTDLIHHLQSGVIGRLESSGLHGALGEAISYGAMQQPVVFRSHGGRALAIAQGDTPIDIAFLSAPSSDAFGNANGYTPDDNDGMMCGSLGYAQVDAEYAKHTVIVTNHLVSYPNTPYGISQQWVDYVLVSDVKIGEPSGIMQGTTRSSFSPKESLIAEKAAKVIEASGYFYDGFSMQMGSGGASLATASFLRQSMLRRNIHASFALGGITGSIVDMHEEGLIGRLLDVQSFDLRAAESLRKNHYHRQISALYYAAAGPRGAAVDQLDFVVLSALEIDTGFNVNVLTGSDGIIRGAIGGHSDTAAGASLTVIATPLTRGRIPCIVEKVLTVTTPGNTVDVLVTDQGIAVNPARKELAQRLAEAGIATVSIEELKQKALAITGQPSPIPFTNKVVGLVAYRDNTLLDSVYEAVR